MAEAPYLLNSERLRELSWRVDQAKRAAQILYPVPADDVLALIAGAGSGPAAIIDVRSERARQDAKWGVQHPPSVDRALVQRDGGCTPERMCEEYEIPTESRAKQLCSLAAQKGELTFAHILVEEVSEAVSAHADEAELRKELVQVAAVAVAWIESIDARRGPQ